MTDIPYRIIRSGRTTVSLEITHDGSVLVRCPMQVPVAALDRFVEQKRPWIQKHRAARAGIPQRPPLTMAEIHALADRAMADIPRRVEHFAPLVGVTFGSITIRNQRSRWGSCSSKGNLNFNCLLMLCPSPVVDYVVVHELCHRLEMNHSPRFWALVEQILPDYRQQKQWLKQNGPALIARMTR